MVANGEELRHLFCAQAEDEDVLFTDLVADLDVRSIQRADGQRAIECHLHVARSGRLLAGG